MNLTDNYAHAELRNSNLFEASDSREVVVVDGTKVVAATLAKIIQQVTLAEAVDIELLMTFLHVYNALMLPTDLVALIRARWHMQVRSSRIMVAFLSVG